MENRLFPSRRILKAASIKIGSLIGMMLIVLSCGETEYFPNIYVGGDGGEFLSFSADQQTLPASISKGDRMIKLEVKHSTNIAQLVPKFTVPGGYTVFANGVEQVSGSTPVNFSKPVLYELRDKKNNTATSWEVSVTTMGCKILIDASHDGGGWWFPQYEATGFNPNAWHQGQPFANALRAKGYEVTELGRGFELKEEMFYGHYIVMRVGGLQAYTAKELEVYTNLLNRGMNLVFFTDHKKFDPVDELGDHLGLQFKGLAYGTVKTFAQHEITANMSSLSYDGSVLTNAAQKPNIEILGWLGGNEYADLNFNGIQEAGEPVGAPVMGVLKYPNSRIFFMGDMNNIEFQPQPFIDNLIRWMGDCSAIP